MATTVLTIVFGILTVLATFVGYYLSIKNKIKEAAQDAINMAEELDKIGAEKLEAAVEQVYNIIPVAVKPFLSKGAVTLLVQATFDKMEEYALKQK